MSKQPEQRAGANAAVSTLKTNAGEDSDAYAGRVPTSPSRVIRSGKAYPVLAIVHTMVAGIPQDYKMGFTAIRTDPAIAIEKCVQP